ncbi:hypothetical protein ACFOSS_05150 [Pseudaeromonas sharmana]|uniref:Uncharacterized protein n=1 Tax=Pseudaeromonas sharmana TaxID=328412 RepID=A0ABV8CKV8_9GAMM
MIGSHTLRTIGALEIFGGITGVVSTVTTMLQGGFVGFGIIFAMLVIVFCFFSLLAGIYLIEGKPKGIKISMVIQAIQIPYLVNSVFAFFIVSGANLLIYIGNPAGWNLNITFDWFISLSGGNGTSFGINFIALVAFLALKKMANSN